MVFKPCKPCLNSSRLFTTTVTLFVDKGKRKATDAELDEWEDEKKRINYMITYVI